MTLRDDVQMNAPIVLASASPRRHALLRLLGITCTVQAANVDETPRPGESPEALTTRLAQRKALAVSTTIGPSRAPTALPDISRPDNRPRCDKECETPVQAGPGTRPDVVLAADTVVVLDDRILGKPVDDAEAVAMLTALRGRAHRVLTGVALAVAGEIRWSGVAETAVWMRAYGDDEIERYVRSGSPRDKAGAYGIQDADFRPVERIEGCLANVVGLPLCELRRALTALDPTRAWGTSWTAATGEDAYRACERALDI